MKLLGAIALSVAVVALLAAAKPSPFTFSTLQQRFQTPVEQQAPAVNPTVCAWDPDDEQWINGAGYVEAGQTVNVTLCLVVDASGESHLTRVTGCTKRGDFEVSLSYDLTWSQRGIVQIIKQSADGCVKICAVGPVGQGAYSQPIAGSNGGVGNVTQYTVALTNTGPRRRWFSLETDMTLDSGNSEAGCGHWPILLNGTCLRWIDINEPQLCWA